MLACSFDAVKKRLDSRGEHTCWFADDPDPSKIAKSTELAIYTRDSDENKIIGGSAGEFGRVITEKCLLWAPDGDEAFDDGSRVLQFDVDNRVRLIGYRSEVDGLCDPKFLSDVWLDAQEYYDILERWGHDFEAERAELKKE
jgi:hypothetical protein